MIESRAKRGRPRRLAPGIFLTGLIIAWALAAGSSPAVAGQVPEVKPGGYVGYVACNKEGCHEPQKTSYLTRAHGRTWDADTPAAADECESCHGPGATHMANPKEKGLAQNLETMAPRASSAVCLTCHEEGNQSTFVESMHSRRNVACVSCHSMHESQSTKGMLKARTDSETCFACHKSERAMSFRTSHHPVREGKMGCSDCHNPHEGSRPKMLQADSVNELCYKCHTEKRGPFLYEHAAVREDCASCHQPHGSNHQRLLVAKPPYLCQRCHLSGHGITGDNVSTYAGLPVAPPAPAGVTVAQTTRSTRQLERGCPNCHVNIHGSNSPSGAYFVR